MSKVSCNEMTKRINYKRMNESKSTFKVVATSGLPSHLKLDDIEKKVEVIVHKNIPTSSFKCDICSGEYTSQTQYSQHVLDVHACPYCHLYPCNGLIGGSGAHTFVDELDEIIDGLDCMKCKITFGSWYDRTHHVMDKHREYIWYKGRPPFVSDGVKYNKLPRPTALLNPVISKAPIVLDMMYCRDPTIMDYSVPGPLQNNYHRSNRRFSLDKASNMKKRALNKLKYAKENFIKRIKPNRIFYRFDALYDKRPGCNTDRYPTVKLPVELEPNQATLFTKLFKVEPVFHTGDVHDHPFSAAVRWMAQSLMEGNIVSHCQRKGVKVAYVDIFGSARLPNPCKWCCMPVITVGDGFRARPENSCLCDVSNCTHMKTSTSMSVDAVYYMGVNQIAEICSKNLLNEHHVLFHRMLKHSGVENDGEYRWTTFNKDGKLFNKVLVGSEHTGNVYSSPQMEWLNVRTWYTPYGYLHYSFRKNYGPMEYGVFVLCPHKLLNEPYDMAEKSVHIVSWELNAPDKNAGFIQKMKDKIAFSLGDLSGFTPRYNIVEYDVPADLYCVVLQHAMFQDISKRDGIVMELKNRAFRWRNEKRQKGDYLDELYFNDYLPHLVASALTASMPAEFGAMHHNYVNDFCVNNPGLWRKSYSRMGRVTVSLGAVIATTLSLAILKPVFLVLLPLVGTLVGASALACANKKQEPLNAKYIYAPLTCQMMDLDDYYTFLSTFDFVKEHVDLPAIENLTNILNNEIVRNGEKYLRIHKPFINTMNYDCGCNLKTERKNSICQFLAVDGVDVISYVNCSCNMLSGMMQRYFKPVPMPNVDYWKENLGGILQDGRTFLDDELEMETHRDAWYRHLATHKKKAVDKAIMGQDDSRYHLSKPSVKQEVTLKLSSVVKAGKPRAFFPKDPLHYAETGPYMYAFKKMLNRNMDGLNSNFLFACGYNPLELGTTLKAGLDQYLPQVNLRVAHEADLRTCEATMCGYNVALEAYLMKEAGVPDKIVNALYGKARCECEYKHGEMKFVMKNCRESGCANTSVGNTIVYSTLLKHCLRIKGVKDYFVLVGGDDAAVYHYAADKVKVESAFVMLHDLGLDPEIKYRQVWYAARFYSGFFAPVTRNDVETLIHIPSIGKAFVKAFTYRMKQGLDPDSWLNETVKQREIIYSHIPLLRSVASFAQPLLKDKSFLKPVPKDFKIDYGGFLMTEMKFKAVKCTANTSSIIAQVYELPDKAVEELEQRLILKLKGNWAGTTLSDSTLLHLLEQDLA